MINYELEGLVQWSEQMRARNLLAPNPPTFCLSTVHFACGSLVPLRSFCHLHFSSQGSFQFRPNFGRNFPYCFTGPTVGCTHTIVQKKLRKTEFLYMLRQRDACLVVLAECFGKYIFTLAYQPWNHELFLFYCVILQSSTNRRNIWRLIGWGNKNARHGWRWCIRLTHLY